jgi:hypothetical protein
MDVPPQRPEADWIAPTPAVASEEQSQASMQRTTVHVKPQVQAVPARNHSPTRQKQEVLERIQIPLLPLHQIHEKPMDGPMYIEGPPNPLDNSQATTDLDSMQDPLSPGVIRFVSAASSSNDSKLMKFALEQRQMQPLLPTEQIQKMQMPPEQLMKVHVHPVPVRNAAPSPLNRRSKLTGASLARSNSPVQSRIQRSPSVEGARVGGPQLAKSMSVRGFDESKTREARQATPHSASRRRPPNHGHASAALAAPPPSTGASRAISPQRSPASAGPHGSPLSLGPHGSPASHLGPVGSPESMGLARSRSLHSLPQRNNSWAAPRIVPAAPLA